MNNTLSLDRIPIIRSDLSRSNAEVSFFVPVPPVLIKVVEDGKQRDSAIYADWRKEAGREIRRLGIRSFGGAVAIELLIPKHERARPVDGYLVGVLDLLHSFGVVQSPHRIEDIRVRRSEYAEIQVAVRAI